MMSAPEPQDEDLDSILHGDALRKVEDAIRAVLPPGEVMVHFDVVVESRAGAGARKIRYRRLSAPGSDPLLSLGLLDASAARLRFRLGVDGIERDR